MLQIQILSIQKTGYESYGEVIQVGNKVTNLNVGDKVVSFYGHETIGIVKGDKVIRVPSYIKPKVALLSILSCDVAKGVLKLDPRQDEKVLITRSYRFTRLLFLKILCRC